MIRFVALAFVLGVHAGRVEDVLEAAAEEAVKTVGKLRGECGASAVLLDDGFTAPRKRAACFVEQYTNCSLSYMQIRCPAECPMVAPSPTFPCIFTCVEPQDCARYSPGHALPDVDGKLCRACPLLGCKYCTSKSTCKECFRGFILEKGRCVFYLDANGVSAKVLMGLVIAIVVLVATVVVFFCCRPKHSNYVDNLQSILDARRHRRLCKMHKWDRTSERAPRSWFDLSVSMIEEDLAGVGMALYYKRIEHLFLCAVVCVACFSLLYAPANLQDYLPVQQETIMEKMMIAFRESEAAPAVLFSPLLHCIDFTPERRAETLQAFAEQGFHMLCAMFGILFVVSLQQSKSCYDFYADFDEKNTDLSDYALLLKNFSSDITDEGKLQQLLQDRLTERLNVEADAIHGVSIAYNLQDFKLRTDVENILSNITRQKEHELNAFSATTTSFNWAKVEAQDRVYAERLFREKRLKSVGRAFIIFRNAKTRDRVLQECGFDGRNPELIKMPELPNVVLKGVDFDPVSVFWENQHNDDRIVRWNAWRGAVKVVIFFIVVNALIILPYNVFVVGVFMSSGADLAGPSQTIAGLLLGIVNQQISAQVYNQAWFAGFKKKERFDAFIFVLNTTVQLFNTWLSLGITAWAVIGKNGGHLKLLTPLKDTGNIGLEAAIGDAFYAMHVPGVLYVNYLMGLLMGGIVPFAQHTLVAKIIYVWRALPDCLLWVLKLILPWAPDDLEVYPRFNAEKAIEAPEMGVAWDYAAFIIHISTAFLVASVVSSSVWKLFGALLAWCVFFHLWSRFMHLRVQTSSSFNGHLLDTMAWLLWGLPMGCLAGSCFIWAQRSSKLPDLNLPLKICGLVLSVLLGAALWIGAYLLLIQPFRRSAATAAQNETVEEVMKHKVFNWYNCNPVYVLKCAYFKEAVPQSHLTGDEALLYRRGKEYLFIPKEKQEKVSERFNDMWEFETYMEWIFEKLGSFARNPGPSQRDLEPDAKESLLRDAESAT